MKQADNNESGGPHDARARMKPRCEAHRRDGQVCGAPAVPGTLVCRRHGGSAPQVRIAARRLVLLERYATACEDVGKHERGTERWYQALDRVYAAEHDLRQHDSDLDLIALMKAEVADPGPPEIRARLLAIAQDRLAGRPWTSPVRRDLMDAPPCARRE